MISELMAPHVVHCCRAPTPDYADCDAVAAPELSAGSATSSAVVTLRRLLQRASLDCERNGRPDWNPFGDLIPPNAKVLLKPNWVLHENRSGAGLDCMVTHTSVVDALLLYLAKTKPRQVVIGDAPVQGCDFEELRSRLHLSQLIEQHRPAIRDLTIRDFRLSSLVGGRSWSGTRGTGRLYSDYVLFDLGTASLLKSLNAGSERLRITMYNPSAMRNTHAPGRHQYLIAREAIEADVVINLPKLKTHKKAGITGALKNLVGTNGAKEYLPHHQKGSVSEGGDCYRDPSILRHWVEALFDRANSARSRSARYLLMRSASTLKALSDSSRDNGEIEGSWFGNDTVWRMALDIQRVLLYGRLDGSIASTPQRKVITVTDAIVAGEGEGPLSPTPVRLGVLTMGMNSAALDLVHSYLMGFDPGAIPIVREAFGGYSFPVAAFDLEQVTALVDGESSPVKGLFELLGVAFRAPLGWRNHCELPALEMPAC